MHPRSKHKTLKLLENNIREKVDDFGFGDYVLDPTPKAQSVKKKSLKSLKVKKKKKLLCERHCEKNKKPETGRKYS